MELDPYTYQILNDKTGSVPLESPFVKKKFQSTDQKNENATHSNTNSNDEQMEGTDVLVKQILNILYQQIFEARNHKLIKTALILPVIEQVVIAIRPFVLVLSILFLLSIILTAIVLVVVILKRRD